MTHYAVVPANLDKDKQVILDLWRRNLADTNHLEERFNWQFLNSPFGRGQIWILEADGQPIGTTSLSMRPLKLRDTLTTAGVAGDLAVNKGHRFLQPALMLQRALISSADPGVRILYGLPNPAGASVMKYVGYREFCCVHRYAKVLRLSHYLKRFGKFGAVVPFIGGVADRGFSALQSFGTRNGKRVTQVLHCFDERFDELWSRLNLEHPTWTVRDQRFLKWRYCECPIRRYKTLALLTQDESTLLGYLIYYVEEQSAVCSDLVAGSGADDLNCLLSSWAALAFGDGLASLSFACPDGALAANLEQHGFTRRSTSPALKPNGTRPHEHSKTLFTHERTNPPLAEDWYYTEGDTVF